MKKRLQHIEELDTTGCDNLPIVLHLIELCKAVQKHPALFDKQIDGYFINFKDETCVILLIENKEFTPVYFSYNSKTCHFHLYREYLKEEK